MSLLQATRSRAADPAFRPWALLVAVSGLLAGAGVFSAWARTSFPEIPPAPNTLGIVSRTTEAGYSSRRVVAVLASGVLAGAASMAAAVAAWLALSSTSARLLGGDGDAAHRGAALALAPLGLLGPVLLGNPAGLVRQTAVHLGLVAVLAPVVGLLHGRFGAPLLRHGRKHPDAVVFILGVGLSWGVVAHLWLDARRPAGWRGWLLCLGPAAAAFAWVLLARMTAALRRERPEGYLAPVAHAMAPSLVLLLYPFLYFDRRPLRTLGAVAAAWCLWRLRGVLAYRPDPMGPTRVMAPYMRALLLPALLALLALDPHYRDHPAGRDMLFYAEEGQHLAWANRILHGETPGRDFFMLYGPLMEYGHALWLRLLGVTVGESRAFFEACKLAGIVASYGCARLLLGSTAAGVVSAIVLTHAAISFRVAAGLAVLLLAFRAADEMKPGLAGTGAAAALAALVSQDVGVAASLAVLAYVILEPLARGPSVGRALARLAAGALVPVVPFLGWLAWRGALGATLDNLLSYPRYVTMGYANAPYPPLSVPPLTLAALLRALLTRESALVWYALPLVYLLGLCFALVPSRAHDGGRARLAAVAVFGLVLFRAALGRSGPGKIAYVAPPAILVILWLTHRALCAARAAGPAGALLGGAFVAASVSMLVGPAVIAMADTAIGRLGHVGHPAQRGLTMPALPRMADGGAPAAAAAPLVAAATLARQALAPGEPMLAIPNDAALYFLADRPNPTRFDLFSQIVTDAHRAEVRHALERRPPKLVFLDLAITRVDGIPDSRQFPEALHFIHDRYDLDRVLGRFLVLRPSATPPAAQPAAGPVPEWSFEGAPWVLIGQQDEAHPERREARPAFIPGGTGPFRADLGSMSTRRFTRLSMDGAFSGRRLELTVRLGLPGGDLVRTVKPVADGARHEMLLDLGATTAWPFLGPATSLTITPKGEDVTRAELHRVAFLDREEPPRGAGAPAP